MDYDKRYTIDLAATFCSFEPIAQYTIKRGNRSVVPEMKLISLYTCEGLHFDICLCMVLLRTMS